MRSSMLPASRSTEVGIAATAAPRAGTRRAIATSATFKPTTSTSTLAAASSSESNNDRSRRDVLTTGLTAALASLAPLAVPSIAAAAADEGGSKKGTMTVPVGSLSTFQKGAIRNEFLGRCDAALRDVLDGGDARVALRLVLHDAGTYDASTKSGGLDGSVILDSEEASRPENREFAPYVAKLRKAKEVIDAQARPGQAQVSWSDLEVLGARAALRKAFGDAKFARSVARSADGKGDPKARSFGANDFPVVFGRIDAPGKGSAGPAGKLPAPDADAETVINFFAGLGAKPNKGGTGGFGPALPLFWARPAFLLWSASVPAEVAAEVEQKLADANPAFADAKKKYDRDRATFSRAGYEIDLAQALFDLCSGKCGAKFDQNAYLYDIEIETVKIS